MQVLCVVCSRYLKGRVKEPIRIYKNKQVRCKGCFAESRDLAVYSKSKREGGSNEDLAANGDAFMEIRNVKRKILKVQPSVNVNEMIRALKVSKKSAKERTRVRKKDKKIKFLDTVRIEPVILNGVKEDAAECVLGF